MAEYIEREALKDHLMSYAGMFTDELGFVVSLQAVLNGIDFQPAADVVEVKHGRWDLFGTHYCCSECLIALRDKVPYCPNCGADMRGE